MEGSGPAEAVHYRESHTFRWDDFAENLLHPFFIQTAKNIEQTVRDLSR